MSFQTKRKQIFIERIMLCNTKFVVQSIILLFVVFHFVNAKATNGTGSDTKIYKGLSAVGHPYLKHMVIIRVRKSYCGGTILTPNIILTAAHCVLKNGSKYHLEEYISKAQVCAGNSEFKCNSPTRQMSRVQNAIVHDLYRGAAYGHDIAIIVLKKALVEDGKTVQRISLPNRKPSIGAECTTIGWGRIKCNDSDVERPQEAQYTLLTRVSFPYCYNGPKFRATELCIADRNETSGPCKGDSGGPLICDGKVAGVVSRGQHNADRHYAIYTNVFSYLEWINESINELRSASLSVRVRGVDIFIIFLTSLLPTVYYSF